MKAEALRELGMFVEAESLLATEFQEELMQAIEIIRQPGTRVGKRQSRR
ncbi:MAG: hypothetical protein IPI16_03200 [Comamonadaceae bacterium]|nr:hypothetical protein [Comamonadaceae bacterium]